MKNFVYRDVAEFQDDKVTSIECIAKAIKSGCFSIIVGAGVSMATTTQKFKDTSAGNFFFPSWGKFVEKLAHKTGVDRNSRDLMAWAEEIERVVKNQSGDFPQLIEDVIYENFPGYDVKEIDREWFFSICALIAKCRDRRPLYIVNLNYDDSLEWFLSKFGYSVKVLSSFPQLVEACDVVSIHPHGFLPRSPEFQKFKDVNIVLTGKHYRKVGRMTEWFHQILQVVVGQSVSLHIGLSGDDPHVLTLFEKVNEDAGIKRVLGFRIIRSNGDDPNLSAMEDAGVVTVSVKEFDQIPETLYEIASKAP